MAKPYIHAKNSVKKYGGVIDDYLPVHDFMDSSKATIADVRHRAILHSSFGIFVAEKIFGTFITNKEGNKVQVRDIAEDHVIEDLGFIPSVDKWFNTMKIESWMGGPKITTRNIPFDNEPKIDSNEVFYNEANTD